MVNYWLQALKLWNSKNNKKYTIPKKGTCGYDQVKELQRQLEGKSKGGFYGGKRKLTKWQSCEKKWGKDAQTNYTKKKSAKCEIKKKGVKKRAVKKKVEKEIDLTSDDIKQVVSSTIDELGSLLDEKGLEGTKFWKKIVKEVNRIEKKKSLISKDLGILFDLLDEAREK